MVVVLIWAMCLGVANGKAATITLSGHYPKTGYQLIYQDEFNHNALNTEDWYYRASDGGAFEQGPCVSQLKAESDIILVAHDHE